MTPWKCHVKGPESDCFRCCIASIIDAASALDVPHYTGDFYLVEYRKLFDIVLFVSPTIDIVNYMQTMNADTYYILGGATDDGENHAVVMQGSRIVSNPDWSGRKITQPINGFYYVFLVNKK